jgi:hypothetical protein
MSTGVKITEHFAQRIASTIRRVEAIPDASSGGKIPVRFEERLFAGGGGGTPIRIAQFSDEWSNDPPGNVKVCQLYKKHPTSTSASAWIPDEGEFAVAVNLFSYIPTPRGGPIYRWAALIPIASGEYTYPTGNVTYVEGVETPETATTSQLWLLLAAQC